MFFVADQAALTLAPEMRRSMLADRAEQFVARHKWPLRLDASGLEVDEYDDALTTYCIVADGDRHVASLRLRPASAGSMTQQHFPGLRRGLETKLDGGVEITRFCSAPGQSPDERLTAVSDLLLGLCRHCQRTGIGSVFGVVFPAVARAIKQAGWPAVVLNTARGADGTLLLAEWIATDMVAWSIQEQRELREELWSRRRRAVAEPERLVA
jgi:N-acyl-L-homoserine lactone synthetase